jgi:nucleoside 2-deoxyribosyltransferase
MHVYTARFEKYPTAEAAYFARDEEMIRDADRVVVFWNGCSPGTGHEVEYARAIGKPIEICMFNQEACRVTHYQAAAGPT